MKSSSKIACFLLLAAWIGHATAFAQPAVVTTNKLPAAGVRALTKRYAGKVASADAKTKTVLLQGPAKEQIVVTDDTKITKDKKPAGFEAIAVDDAVTGDMRQDAAGNWAAISLRDGTPRQPVPEPVPK